MNCNWQRHPAKRRRHFYAAATFVAAAVWAKLHRRAHATIAFVSHSAAPTPPPAPPPSLRYTFHCISYSNYPIR